MKAYLFESERLVYEGERWGIIIDDDPKRPRTYGSHQACTTDYATYDYDSDTDESVYGSICWEVDDDHAVCENCGVAVPEGVQGLIIMTSKEVAWNG